MRPDAFIQRVEGRILIAARANQSLRGHAASIFRRPRHFFEVLLASRKKPGGVPPREVGLGPLWKLAVSTGGFSTAALGGETVNRISHVPEARTAAPVWYT